MDQQNNNNDNFIYDSNKIEIQKSWCSFKLADKEKVLCEMNVYFRHLSLNKMSICMCMKKREGIYINGERAVSLGVSLSLKMCRRLKTVLLKLLLSEVKSR